MTRFTLGSVPIDFRKELAEVLTLIGGDRELERLRSVAHLGVASTVFTGAKHSVLKRALAGKRLVAMVSDVVSSGESLAGLRDDVVSLGGEAVPELVALSVICDASRIRGDTLSFVKGGGAEGHSKSDVSPGKAGTSKLE